MSGHIMSQTSLVVILVTKSNHIAHEFDFYQSQITILEYQV